MATPKGKSGKPKPKRKPAPSMKRPDSLKPPPLLTKFDMDFCHIYANIGQGGPAYKQLCPDLSDATCRTGAMRLLHKPQIREHLKNIYRTINRQRDRAVQISASAALLSLEVADDRLYELMGQRRRTKGEAVSRDIKQLIGEGTAPNTDESGRIVDYTLTEEYKASLKEGAPIEDSDLLKAIDLTYKRKGGILKAEKTAVDVTVITNMLYRPPAWKTAIVDDDSQVIEGEV